MRKQLTQNVLAIAVVATGILGLTVGQANADTIVGVTIEDVSSEFGDRLAIDSINGAGFDEINGYHSTADGDMWLNEGVFSGGTDPFPCHITYDLGANHDLSSVKIWNYNGPAALTAGAKDIEILVASSEGGAFTSLGSFVLNQAPGSAATDFGQVIDLSSFAAADDTRLVRFEITTNHGFNYSLAGLSEVRFDGAVPTAATPGTLIYGK